MVAGGGSDCGVGGGGDIVMVMVVILMVIVMVTVVVIMVMYVASDASGQSTSRFDRSCHGSNDVAASFSTNESTPHNTPAGQLTPHPIPCTDTYPTPCTATHPFLCTITSNGPLLSQTVSV